jgi:hypothetical protein
MNAQSKRKISKNCPGGKDGLRRHITAASAGILVSWDAEMPHGGITSGDRSTVIQSLTSKIAAAIACPFRLKVRAPGFGEVQRTTKPLKKYRQHATYKSVDSPW